MGTTNDRGRWYLVKRVPKRFAHLDPRVIVRVALRTDSKREAEAKAPAVEAELVAYWEALAAGDSLGAAARYAAAVRLAESRGFRYRPTAELAAGALDDLLRRYEALVAGGALAPRIEAAAVLGAVDAPRFTQSTGLEEYFGPTRERTVKKSERAKHRWENARRLAVKNAIDVLGDKYLDEVSPDDALAFRTWWVDRMIAEGVKPNTINMQIGHLSDVYRTLAKLKKLPLVNPFVGTSVARKKGGKSERPPFSTEWIRDKLLAEGALDGFNDEGRDVLLMIVNTGARPNEILAAPVEAFRVEAKVPHLLIRPTSTGELKTAESAREVPLVGVSLDAARRIAARGGISCYAGKNDSYSAAANKFLRENGLMESPKHVVYSLRHSFEDRMLEAGIDDRIRADVMGHAYERPRYGAGGRLATIAGLLAAIAL